MERLDEKGFVFLDHRGRPYQVRTVSGEPWLCYWNEEYECFATLRPIGPFEMAKFHKDRLSPEKAGLYLNARKEV